MSIAFIVLDLLFILASVYYARRGQFLKALYLLVLGYILSEELSALFWMVVDNLSHVGRAGTIQ